MVRTRITINLETKEPGRVPVGSFREALAELAAMLHHVEIQVSEDRRSRVSWDISELGLGSATISLEPASEEYSELAAQVTQSVISGLRSLSEERIRPEFFSDAALEGARRLARLVDDRVDRINLFSNVPEQQLYITEGIAVNVGAILEHLEFMGSVEGRLELLSGREGERPYFGVRDVVSRASVRCYFPEDMLEQALQAFRKRVVVHGLMRSDSSGKPRRIRVHGMELVPGLEALPQPEDVRGTMKGQTGGLSSERYVEERFGGR